MEIKRDSYLKQLIDYQWDGQVKVITGIRRCGKSYLLNVLFRRYLLEHGVKKHQIMSLELDLTKDIQFRNPLHLAKVVRETVERSDEQFYLFVDEIQMSDEVTNPYNPKGKKITFFDALNDLKSLHNLDVYVTGSNSRMLSSDILSEFRGRSDEIRVHPLSFSEFYPAVGGDQRAVYEQYAAYGGMPLVLSRPDDRGKISYLNSLFSTVYLRDIVERKGIKREDILAQVTDLLCSSTGSLTNPTRIANTLRSRGCGSVSVNTISSYMSHLRDSFLFSEAKRYDVRGRAYLEYPCKYYCEDVGLRNARLGFRQQEPTHLMENIIYNELIIRGFSVDVGVVYATEKNGRGSASRKALEIDFVVNSGNKRTYIQSAYSISSEEKEAIEKRSFRLIGDLFARIIVRSDIGMRWYDAHGVLNMNVLDFLLDGSLI